jgi:hypothetical protein
LYTVCCVSNGHPARRQSKSMSSRAAQPLLRKLTARLNSPVRCQAAQVSNDLRAAMCIDAPL